jgi:hypothetical protein
MFRIRCCYDCPWVGPFGCRKTYYVCCHFLEDTVAREEDSSLVSVPIVEFLLPLLRTLQVFLCLFLNDWDMAVQVFAPCDAVQCLRKDLEAIGGWEY